MLTYQTYKLLMQLRQFTIPRKIERLNNDLEVRIVDKTDLMKNPYNYNQLKDNSIIARTDELRYLEDKSYIKIKGKTIEITHKGYRPFQLTAINFVWFLFKSIFVPMVVAYLTAHYNL